MEPRSALAECDQPSERWILRVGCQGVFGLKNGLANVLGVERDKVRVLTGNVGGSFGMKSAVYPEYLALFHAARALGRPVKWTDERSESFVSDSHGRDHEMTAELALDAECNFLAVRVTGYGNLGAYVGRGAGGPPTANAVKNTIGVYQTPLIEVSTRIVVTNTPPVGAYRGAGRPEGNYYMERLVDTAAAELGFDKIELRRRNHIPEAAMPHKAPNGTTYDSGEFTAVLDQALAQSDWDGFAARKEESRRRRLLRGHGIGEYLEVTGPPANEMGGICFEPDGNVTIITGTLDYGQGHWTPFAQILHQQPGVPFDRIRLLQGDSDELIAGGGTGASKSLMASGTAIVDASEKVIEQGRQIAAHVLEAAVADVEFSRGRFVIAGTDRFIDIMELATMIRRGLELPPELPQTLDVQHIHESSPSAFPNGCHIAEVEIDPETGVVAVVKYSMVNDFGVIVNPLLVAGQAHGGVVQGIGQALMERTVFDEDGQFLTGSFTDYALPRASDAVMFAIDSHPVPAKTNPLGAKGCAEAGCAGSLPAVMNAVVDALSEYRVRHIDMPATPFRVLTPLRLGELLMDAGVPPGVVNIVPGYGETAGAALAAHRGVDKVAFTGSHLTGQLIVQASAGNLKRVSLELGGKSPDVVFADADLETAVPGAGMAVFANSGQICSAGTRLFVERKIYDEFTGRVAEFGKALKVGNGLDPDTQIGPLVSEQQLERVTGYLATGRQEGARPLTGGQPLTEGAYAKGYFVPPTVFADVRDDMRIAQEEIFGPLISAIPFTDVDEVIRRGNATTFGLGSDV